MSRETVKRATAYLETGATEGTVGISSQWKFDTTLRSTLSGKRYLRPYSAPQKKE